MKFLIFLFSILSINFMNSQENSKTVTSFFVSCRDTSCCEKNLENCKSTLPEDQEICQRGFEACKDVSSK